MFVLAGAALLTGCQGLCDVDDEYRHATSELPPASPLWGYRGQPGISTYDSSEKEIYLGESYQPRSDKGWEHPEYAQGQVSRQYGDWRREEPAAEPSPELAAEGRDTESMW